jgi:hypothetical protein
MFDPQPTSHATVTVAGKHASSRLPPRTRWPADECDGVHPHAGGNCASTGRDGSNAAPGPSHDTVSVTPRNVSRISQRWLTGLAVTTVAVTGPAVADADTGPQFSMKKNVGSCAYVPASAGGLVDTTGAGNGNRDRAISANSSGSTITAGPLAAGAHVVT